MRFRLLCAAGHVYHQYIGDRGLVTRAGEPVPVVFGACNAAVDHVPVDDDRGVWARDCGEPLVIISAYPELEAAHRIGGPDAAHRLVQALIGGLMLCSARNGNHDGCRRKNHA